jgi:hypothetical protein
MISEQFVAAGIKLYGRKKWKSQLAHALGINVATVHRLAKLPPSPSGSGATSELPRQIPGPYEVALKGLLQHKRAQDILEREARKLLPHVRKKIKFRKTPRKPKDKKDGIGLQNPAGAAPVFDGLSPAAEDRSEVVHIVTGLQRVEGEDAG